METQITTTNPVRSDLATNPAAPAATPGASRRWAVAGIGAALAGIVGTTASGMVSAVYEEKLQGDPQGIVDRLAQQTGAMLVFHVSTVVSAIALVVFAAGLFRRLRHRLDVDHLAPMVAMAGLLGTAVVLVIGSGLDTEFVFGVQEEQVVNPANAALYNHWIGTIPWVYVLVGVTGLALWSAYRAGAVVRWMGVTGLVLGGLTVVFGISPLQYMAAMTGQLMLLAVAIGFVVGDRAYRASR